MLKTILAAFAIGVISAGTASATPASSPVKADLLVEAELIQVQHHHHHRDRKHHRHVQRHRHHHHHYVPGRRYRSAPHGWHRHHHRPHNWQRRGCIMAGPLWFCP